MAKKIRIVSCYQCSRFDDRFDVCMNTGNDVINGQINKDCPLHDWDEDRNIEGIINLMATAIIEHLFGPTDKPVKIKQTLEENLIEIHAGLISVIQTNNSLIRKSFDLQETIKLKNEEIEELNKRIGILEKMYVEGKE